MAALFLDRPHGPARRGRHDVRLPGMVRGLQVAYTGADLIAMARMVMERERAALGTRTRHGTRTTTEINGGKGKPAPTGLAQ